MSLADDVVMARFDSTKEQSAAPLVTLLLHGTWRPKWKRVDDCFVDISSSGSSWNTKEQVRLGWNMGPHAGENRLFAVFRLHYKNKFRLS
jgi:hypothetical protein